VNRWIAHVDMDAFYASVELLRRPELRGKPVVVATGADPNSRGVVMAASYEARKFGIHSAMPLSVAYRRCPSAVLIPRDMRLYREVSGQVMGILRRHSDCVEVVGLDEAYLDLSDALMPKTWCQRIKHEIRVETGLTCSVGLAPNKLLAKVASDLDKPDGFRHLRADEWLDVVGDQPVALIPGVGPKTRERLAVAGIAKVRELANAEPASLERLFGPRLAHSLHSRANGINDAPVVSEREPKSESRETTFASDVDDPAILLGTLDRLVNDLCRNLGSSGYRGRTVTLKIRLRQFRTLTRSRTVDVPTREPEVVRATARALLGSVELDAPVRLIGVGVLSLTRDSTEPGEEDAPTGHDSEASPLTLDV
jgi:nucleotidyltransferase/DNA polymerase involved in DNA repair